METLGGKIKRMRKEKKLTQKQLAEKMGGLDHTTISKWESDVYEPDTKSLKKLSELLEISIDELLGGTYTKSELDLTQDIEDDLTIKDIKTKYNIDIKDLTDDEWRGIVAYVQAARAIKKE